jgi:hypothetical protein
MDGLETTQLILSGEVGGLYKAIPIVAMTAKFDYLTFSSLKI